jgi:hypothetical protein
MTPMGSFLDQHSQSSASSVALALKREARIPSISLNRSVIRIRGYAARSRRLPRIEFSVHTGKRQREAVRRGNDGKPRKGGNAAGLLGLKLGLANRRLH